MTLKGRLFTCPFCSVQTIVNDDLVGAKGRCATCSREIVVDPGRLQEASELMIADRDGGKSTDYFHFLSAQSKSKSKSIIKALVASIGLLLGTVGLGVFVLFVVLPIFSLDVISERRSVERARLEEIMIALRQYHQNYGTFPPAVIYDESGVPMHSWRALLIPYLDSERSFEAYDFGEPWDSPKNSVLHSLSMPAFQPASPSLGFDLRHTAFMAVSGSRTMFPPHDAIQISEVIDDHASTIMVVQVADSQTHWLAPIDIDEASFLTALDSKRLMPPTVGEVDGTWVGMVGGEIVWISSTTSTQELEGMLDRSDGR